MRQSPTASQPVQIPQLPYQVRCQHQRRDIGQILRYPPVNCLYSIPGQQQRIQSGRKRKIRKGSDVIICEVDGILSASNTEVFYSRDLVA